MVESRNYKGYNIITSMGSFYFIIPPILSFLFVTNEMLREKEKKQREYLQIMGIECKVYWSSWLITIIMMSIV